MPCWIALLRGINVGGHNVLPMAALKQTFASLGYSDVVTYVQSGNVVFDAAQKNAKTLSAAIAKRITLDFEFTPHVLVLSPAELQAAMERNPFPEATPNPSTLHFFFLSQSANKPNVAGLAAACAKTERYLLTNQVFYLHAPDGIGRSKLAAAVEKHLGVPVTARNCRTVEKLAALAAER